MKEGFFSELGAKEKVRERIEKEQELKAQESAVASLSAAIVQSQQKLAQIKSAYDSEILNERLELHSQQRRTEG